MEPVKRKAGRPPSQTQSEKPGPPLRITVDADRVLTQQAKKLKMSKGKYASAAIAFFAESGLDPTEERPQGLSEIGSKVSAETLAVRKQNVDIGNRLISIIRGWEGSLYGFLKQQELAQNTYLAAIERNLLERMVAMETAILAPMAEQIIKAAIEAYTGRIVSERTYLKVMEREQSEWASQHGALSKDRDKILVERIEEYAKNHPSVTATVTPKPTLTPVPVKPVVPATGAPTASATPAPTGLPQPDCPIHRQILSRILTKAALKTQLQISDIAPVCSWVLS